MFLIKYQVFIELFEDLKQRCLNHFLFFKTSTHFSFTASVWTIVMPISWKQRNWMWYHSSSFNYSWNHFLNMFQTLEFLLFCYCNYSYFATTVFILPLTNPLYVQRIWLMWMQLHEGKMGLNKYHMIMM